MADLSDFLAPRTCLVAPLPEHAAAADLLSAAADAIVAGNLNLARDHLRLADMPALFEFAKKLMGPINTEIHRRRPVAKTATVTTRAAARMPTPAEAAALYRRDGWRCRFCGCRVVSSRARSFMRACIPGAIPWADAEGYHGAFFALTASVDHVLAHSAGGRNELENLVTACWSCQFGRGAYTLEEFGLSDPRLRPPVVDGWDGLCRVMTPTSAAAALQISLVETPQPLVPPRDPATAGQATSLMPRAFSSSQVEWLARLDGIQPTPSRRLIDFLDNCAEIAISWSLNKVSLARMKVGAITIEFMGVQPDGLVEIPWSVEGNKEMFRDFAEKLAADIPGAVAYETPKQWVVARPDKKRLNVLELLDNLPLLEAALKTLNAAMKAAT